MFPALSILSPEKRTARKRSMYYSSLSDGPAKKIVFYTQRWYRHHFSLLERRTTVFAHYVLPSRLGPGIYAHQSTCLADNLSTSRRWGLPIPLMHEAIKGLKIHHRRIMLNFRWKFLFVSQTLWLPCCVEILYPNYMIVEWRFYARQQVDLANYKQI